MVFCESFQVSLSSKPNLIYLTLNDMMETCILFDANFYTRANIKLGILSKPQEVSKLSLKRLHL